MSEVLYDEKVEQILALLAEGKTKDEVSEFYEQDWKTLYIYMNRKGFRWDKELETFVAKQEQEVAAPSVDTLNTKAAQIIRMLNVKHPNIQQVAAKQGFSTIDELGIYMKSQGYRWNDEITNYVEDTQLVNTNLVTSTTGTTMSSMDEKAFLQFLLQHQGKLKELLLVENTSQLVTYKFKGSKGQKTLSLASSATLLIEDYSKEFNMTKRLVVETALAEFFERHGYKERLKAVTM